MNCLSMLPASMEGSYITLGCPYLDERIGGIPMQGITEIAGEAGCGKTQLCLSLALQIQLDSINGGKNGAAAYLSCGEGTFPIRRLSQLATAFEGKTGIPSQKLLSNVHIEHCYNIDDTLSVLKHKIRELCHHKNVKLLLIDSLAGLVRFEFDSSKVQEMRARTSVLFALARELKLLSDIFKIAVVVVNQVKADFADEVPSLAGLRGGAERSLPALGMAWAYCVNTRITLHRDSQHLRACPTLSIDEDTALEGVLSSGQQPGVSVQMAGSKRPALSSITQDRAAAIEANEGFYRAYNEEEGEDGAVPGKCLRGGTARSSSCISADDKENISADDKENISRDSSSSINRDCLAPLSGILPLHRRIKYFPTAASGSAPPEAVGRSRRWMRLELSPVRPSAQCAYEILLSGVQGIGTYGSVA